MKTDINIKDKELLSTYEGLYKTLDIDPVNLSRTTGLEPLNINLTQVFDQLLEEQEGGNLDTVSTSNLGTLLPYVEDNPTVGDDSHYWTAGYFDTVYVNGTAYLSGTVAGEITVVGDFVPATTESLGTASDPWLTAYITSLTLGGDIDLDSNKIDFNATASIDGVTAGVLTSTGDIVPSIDNTDDIGTTSKAFKDLYLSGKLYIDNTGVIRESKTGWGTPTSTIARATYATFAGQTISASPTQAEVQNIDDHLVILSQTLGALITDLKAYHALLAA